MYIHHLFRYMIMHFNVFNDVHEYMYSMAMCTILTCYVHQKSPVLE